MIRSVFRLEPGLDAKPSDLATVNWGLEHIERLRRGRAETRQSMVALTTGIGGVAIGAFVALTAPMVTTIYQGRPADTNRLTIDHQALVTGYVAIAAAAVGARRAAKADDGKALEAAFPGEEDRYFLPTSIGSTPTDADDGAAAILAGIKTTTSSAFWEYPDGHIPFVGALSVLLDGQGRARAIIVTEWVEIMPFGSVDEDFARAYGEGERTLAWWRPAMGAWYRASALRHGAEFSDSTPLICEWIAVARRL